MSKRNEEDFLLDIMEASRRILSYTQGVDYTSFMEDLKTQDSVIRNLEIIGEAVKNLSKEFRAQHDHIPWKSMSGMRDRLIHDYFGVNLDIVWGVISEDLPILFEKIGKIVY
ncbi:HepT-like ribonuclease domain-containing protein [Desulfobotulus mexicanus]|uniref:DUF86 domain-containing protein n=1 Tax=Desulfobotulus mexicanus TaxID=2586642 RepID=A0A5Q4VDW2_9BACT|nr:DUF86 domain-containing protein [Desulfobotulus mexicanus]TYT75825.1 DUF86 domain-containing protein [Desulfobotulus mexicanus]